MKKKLSQIIGNEYFFFVFFNFLTGIYLPNPFVMGRTRHNNNFFDSYIFTQLLYYGQDFTKYQSFCQVYIYPTLCHWLDTTKYQFFWQLYIYPTLLSCAGCNKVSIFCQVYIYPTLLSLAGHNTVSIFFGLLYIYPTPLLWAGCNKVSIFKQSTACLNSEFPFSFLHLAVVAVLSNQSFSNNNDDDNNNNEWF